MGQSGPRRGGGLPTETTRFVGRQHEITEVKRLLSVNRLLTLTGLGGVGKSRLAAHVAGKLSRAFRDGVWLVPLAALQDEALIPNTIADVLGIRDETGRDLLTVLLEHLRERQLLLVLDNCEHLLADTCARLVSAILREAAGVRVLATSRHRLGLVGEQLLQVSPLPVPTLGELTRRAAAAATFPALALFADRAAAVVPHFQVTTENQEAVAQVCRRLDGLPLAIELAAVQMRTLDIEQIVERLDDRYHPLTGADGAPLPRHQTLRATVDWSYELCTSAEQRAWALLSAFAGSFDLSAAEAVCAEEDAGEVDVLDAISGLVDKSVLVSEHVGASTRYRLLSSLWDYGLEKLHELGQAFTARRRHRDYYLRLAEDYEKQWFGPRQPEIVAHLRAEHDNIRAAFDFCLTTPGQTSPGLRLVGTLWFYWVCRGMTAEPRHWLRKLALREGVKQRGTRAKAQWAGAVMALIHSRSAAVLQASDPLDQPPVLEQEDPPIIPLTASSIPDRGDLMNFAIIAWIDLACTLVFWGRPDRAVPLCAQALTLCTAQGEQWARSYVLRTLATAHWAMGQYDSAACYARDSLRLDHAVVGPQGLSRAFDVLAVIAADQGAADHAAMLLGASEQLWPDTSRGPAESRRQAGRIQLSELRTRKTLGDRGFARAFRRGSTLSPDEAVACALREQATHAGVGTPQRTEHPAPPGAELTPRERQVAELVAQGLTDKQIAAALVIAQRTAEGHVQSILTKLRFTTRIQVVTWFRSHHPSGEGPASR
jgi:predicted ATPase/DNA-binding CsgD family transcriptional regulator